MPPSYTVVRTRRKTICLRVLEDGTLEVRAPLRTSAKAIEALLTQHASWIEERQQAAAARNAARKRVCLYPGGRMLYMGTWYPVVGSFEGRQVTFDGTVFSLPLAGQGQPGSAMEAWLKNQAKALLQKRCAQQAAEMGVSYRQIRVGSAASRWGSCSSKGNLNFSYRVALLPDELLDYVVVHELCHLRQMNHSPAFWALVEAQMPDYKGRRKKLAGLTKEIDFIHWNTVKDG